MTSHPAAPPSVHPDLSTVFENWASGERILQPTEDSRLYLPSKVASSSSSNQNLSSFSSSGDPSSIIHDAARITDWDLVLELCESTPQAASYKGRDGWTALHHACNKRCPRSDVIAALIHAYADALLQEEEKGWLPLHYACRFKAPRDVVRLLLTAVPESGEIAVASRDKQGRRPLYYAIRYDAPPGVAGLLIGMDPSAVLDEDQNEESPLALVWDSWAEKLEGKRIVHSFLPGGFPEDDKDATPEQTAVVLRERLAKEPKLKKRWNQVNMLLRAAFGFPYEEDNNYAKKTSSEERQWRIVHATAAVKCHLSLFRLACALHPEQARELDQGDLRGRPVRTHQTALHLAASSNAGGEPGKTVIYTLLSLYREAAEIVDKIDGSLPLHNMVENPRKQDWPNHAAILYHFYQRAIQIPDAHGKLPLHRAAAGITHEDHGDDREDHSVIIQLVRAFPQAAAHVDQEGRLPFHHLCQSAEKWDDDVEAVYNNHRAAVSVRSELQRLPLHMAAHNSKAKESLVQRIVSLHPRAAMMEDANGHLPLHLACQAGKRWDHGTKGIHEAYVTAIRTPERNARGWHALHMATASPKETGELIATLVELYPEASNMADNDGRFPFHLACTLGKSWNGGLRALFDANPSALSRQDKNGLLPIYICALSYCKKDDSQKSKIKLTPKLEAEKEIIESSAEAAELDILFNIIRADPTTISSK